ncbi:MAG TPA: phosphoglucosamine mutase [Lachnospiraceae bacterium]|nr:phosphoglucosamine mutase [Lachnospiraceae bacterium]
MGKFFGTDGVRGVANVELTPELAMKIGKAGAYVLTKHTNHTAKIIVGMDTRISGGMLESALVAGICSVGAQAVLLGVVPTPAVAYLVRKYNADAGIVISASHNPVQDNGIKFFNSQGYKLRDDIEDEIEQYMTVKLSDIPSPSGDTVGSKEICKTAIDDYVEFLKNSTDISLEGLSVAIDCANGATYQAAPKALRALGAKVFVLHAGPNGKNINLNCGSTHMESLIDYVKNNEVDLGIAFDGDGDRCLAVDGEGNFVNGDEIMAICAKYMKECGKLKNNTIVATVMSNLGLSIMGEKNGIKIEKTKVGDRYVLEHILENGDCFGGEQSGHIIFFDYNTTGDGTLTAIQLLTTLKKTGQTLAQARKIMEILPQVLVNARVDNKKKAEYATNETIRSEIEQLEERFNGEGRVLVRASGTEPIVRVMIEGRDMRVMQEEAERLSRLIEGLLN